MIHKQENFVKTGMVLWLKSTKNILRPLESQCVEVLLSTKNIVFAWMIIFKHKKQGDLSAICSRMFLNPEITFLAVGFNIVEKIILKVSIHTAAL